MPLFDDPLIDQREYIRHLSLYASEEVSGSRVITHVFLKVGHRVPLKYIFWVGICEVGQRKTPTGF